MSILLETTFGDIVIDLDLEGSPELCKNILKLVKARYYTSTLIYNVHPKRFCQLGDPRGNGSGGGCIYGIIDATTKAAVETTPATSLERQQQQQQQEQEKALMTSHRRFLKSSMGRPLTIEECQQKGRVVATEMNGGIQDTIGSQLLITTSSGRDHALDGYQPPLLTSTSNTNTISSTATTTTTNSNGGQPTFRSVGQVVEDPNNVLDQIDAAYCDANGRPYADIRIIRALVVADPFVDPPGFDRVLQSRGVVIVERKQQTNKKAADDDNKNAHDDNDINNNENYDTSSIYDDRVVASPSMERPIEEIVERRIQADQIDQDTEADAQKLKQQQEEMLKREDKSRAVVLEMLGDLPSADIKAPENVLFVCKLNPVTEDEDLELIFSRFDENVKAEIIRDQETGSSLQYAFIEFTTKDRAVEAYFKMNNALVDDRRIKVDFSQSVAKVWDRYRNKQRMTAMPMPMPTTTNDPSYAAGHHRSQQSSSSRSHHSDRHKYHPSSSRVMNPPPHNNDDRHRNQRPSDRGHGRNGNLDRPYHRQDAASHRRNNERDNPRNSNEDDRHHRHRHHHDRSSRHSTSDGRKRNDDDDDYHHHRSHSSSSSSSDDDNSSRKDRRRKKKKHHKRHRHYDHDNDNDDDNYDRGDRHHRESSHKRRKRHNRSPPSPSHSADYDDERSNSSSSSRRRRHSKKKHKKEKKKKHRRHHGKKDKR